MLWSVSLFFRMLHDSNKTRARHAGEGERGRGRGGAEGGEGVTVVDYFLRNWSLTVCLIALFGSHCVSTDLSTSWAAVKDLVNGNLKKVPINSIIITLPSKKYVQFEPVHFQDFSSKAHYARLKKETDGVTRIRPLRILHIRCKQLVANQWPYFSV